MPGLPDRETLTTVWKAINAVKPSAIIGLARPLDEAQAQILYIFEHGIGGLTTPIGEVPEALQLQARGVRHHEAVAATSSNAIEWQVAFAGATRLLSVPIPDLEPVTRLWAGFAGGNPPTGEEICGLERVAAEAALLLNRPILAADDSERLRRLDLASGLLPALMQVLDIREGFDPLSDISKRALPHDMLALGLYNEPLTQLTMHARTGAGPDLGGTFPQPYPPAVVRASDFDIIDDRVSHPLERDRPPTKLGNRSSIRVRLRVGDRVIGGLGFMSAQPGAYSTADVDIARRLADYVAVTLSHQRLAEQARQHDDLRARTDNLELLDGMLMSLIDTGDLRHVFERISKIVQKVLPHDAAALAILLPGGLQARVHGSFGMNPPLPEIVPVPEDLVANPYWHDEIVEDVGASKAPRDAGARVMGFQSILRVPVKLEGRFAGTVIFLSRTLSTFKAHHMLLARRIADRLALLVARDREDEASKRADEASARATKLELRVRVLTEELDARTGLRRIVGNSPEWRAVLTQATQVAPMETTVLLLGESGTGKEVIARFVHRASPRNGGPFIALNCAALPEQLLEAELFGYERGAYTGATQSKPGQLEQAAGGTLFLDEVGEMSLPAQAKFLRVLQEREFQRLGGTRVLRTDARIIAATNRDLEKAIELNQFREDLYYRLNVFAIYLPALRERPNDILPLCEAFLTELGRSIGRPPAGISGDARDRLVSYHWPGNVRELRNILERAAILCEGGLITPDHLAIGLGARVAAARSTRAVVASQPSLQTPQPPSTSQPPPTTVESAAGPPASVGDLKSLEREMIEQALQRVRFNKAKAARDLGLSRQQLYMRMKKYGLE